MSTILHIETATKTCSVAIADNGLLLGYKDFTGDGYTHAENLNAFINTVLNDTGLSIENLNAIAVSGGPGSYTGLRIGTSCAKGLCFGLEIPLIEVNSLASLGCLYNENNDTHKKLMPMFDARRMEVYTQIFDSEMNQKSDIIPLVVDEKTFTELYTEDHILFGDGADKLKPFLKEQGLGHIEIVEDFKPSARGMIKIASEKFSNGDFVDLAYYEPNYLKEFKAG